MTMNQKTATYNAIKFVCKQFDIKHEDNEVLMLSTNDKKHVNAILFAGFRNKEIELSQVYDDTQLKNYISGLINNWLRKDTRFNGGIHYTAKNPGSRSGSQDAQIKALKAVQTMRTDENEIKEIQSYIDARLSEINKSKQKVSVNVDDLPAELREKLGL